MPQPSTYRVADLSAVPFADAVTAWAGAGYDVLRATARSYRAVVTYKELAEQVQERSGIRTSVLMMHWVGSVLESVARRCADSNEPPLTSLCVHQDGTIGDGYAKAAEMSGRGIAQDIELHAARDRLACYRVYAANLPADGGEPAFTEQVAKRRATTQHRTANPPPKFCPTCFTALPASGRCDYCA